MKYACLCSCNQRRAVLRGGALQVSTLTGSPWLAASRCLSPSVVIKWIKNFCHAASWMKPVLLKSIRISSEVCISTKPRMLKIIKTKIHIHSIFPFPYPDSEWGQSLGLVCHGFLSPWLPLKCLGLWRATSPLLLASFKNLPFRDHSDILVVFSSSSFFNY